MKTDRPEPADEEPGGPTEEPYPSGSGPAGPEAEAMAPEQFMAGGELGAVGDTQPALGRITEIRARLRSHPAVILEYDGVVDELVGDWKTILRELAEHAPLAVVGNRPTDEMQSRVDVAGITCAGTDRPGSDELDMVEQRLLNAAADVEGVGVERTPQAVAIRVPRSAPDAAHVRAHDMVAEALEDFAGLTLHTTNGIHELRPASDRGAVVTRLLASLNDPTPLYIGPLEAAEPAFRVVRARGGIGIVLSPEPDQEGSTSAEYRLADGGEIGEFLSRLTRSLAGDPNP